LEIRHPDSQNTALSGKESAREKESIEHIGKFVQMKVAFVTSEAGLKSDMAPKADLSIKSYRMECVAVMRCLEIRHPD
jgi:hypothetical protein